MQRARIIAIVALGGLVGTAVLLAAWALDARAHEGEVLPNVTVAGQRTRGLTPAQLGEVVDDVASSFSEAQIEVRTPGGSFESTIAELGVSVDQAGTEAATMAAGRQGAFPRRFLYWARSFLSASEIGVAIDVDRHIVDRVVAEHDADRIEPTEPYFEFEGESNEIVVREGRDGRGIDPSRLADQLRRTDPTKGRVVLELEPSDIPPRYDVDDARQLAADLEGLALDGFSVTAGGVSAPVPVEMLRTWVQTSATPTGLDFTLNPDTDILAGLAQVLEEAGQPAKPTTFAVVDEAVELVPPQPGTTCCAPEALDILEQALVARDTSVADLPLTEIPAPDDESDVRGLGINEMVSTFTTEHPAGQSRVVNIQRMADAIRGTVIRPGETFSLNGIVGPRTREKGYVPGGFIGGDGRLSSDIGGGVSQFATTMFNAAFFGGVDITEYFMHTLYFSRYPYGREATVSHPAPDLKWRNDTPYGILVWTSYTPTSITVSFYSTKHVTAEQTGQSTETYAPRFIPEELRPDAEPTPSSTPTSQAQEPDKPLLCTRVITERTRTYLDGSTDVDTFRANYAPAEGVLC